MPAGQPEPSTPELNIDLGMILPEEWQAVSTWESINIDADAEQEYLLFYRYDASTTADGEGISGPIGAVIYDPQTPIGMPEDSRRDSARPPAPWLQPYALLPNYWQGAGYGFVAPPRQTGLPEWIVVKREEDSETENRYFEVLAQQMPASVQRSGGGGNARRSAPARRVDRLRRQQPHRRPDLHQRLLVEHAQRGVRQHADLCARRPAHRRVGWRRRQIPDTDCARPLPPV